jgi:hypothetical protein
MVLANRRDAGYTIISRFENSFRNYIAETLLKINPDFKSLIPTGVIKKAKDRYGVSDFDTIEDLLDNSDQ